MRRAGGFSLIEIVVALAILGVGILAVMKLFPISIRNTRLAAERTDVSGLASARLGQLRATGGDQLLGTGFERMPLWTFDAVNQIIGAQELYERYSTAVDVVAGGRELALQRVTFMAQMSDGRYETYVTYIAKQ